MSEWNTASQLPASFFSIAEKVYASDDFWIKESEPYIRTLFSTENSFFGSGKAWVDTEKNCARLAGFYNPDQLIDGKRAAYFGFWECDNQLEANQALFERFERWARACGADVIYGPINFNTFGLYRIRMSHHENGYFPGEPYNPSYYPELMEKLGYGVSKRFYSWFGRLDNRAEKSAPLMSKEVAKLEQQGIKFSRLTPEYWLNHLPEIFLNVDEIFKDNFAYSGITFEAFEKAFGEGFAYRFCPKASVLATDAEGNIAGFFVAFPDYSPLLKQSSPKKVEASQIRYNDHFKLLEHPKVLGKSGGVSPAYRKSGLFSVMSYLLTQWSEASYELGGATLVREDNPSARVGRLFFSQPGDWSHEYALFSKTL
ncbi:hypothetical protein [Alkalimarinus coralli]|uniref:hypothetical protein n=1 Tax=Alkalimarinus coralli TaxID=2935863 RepID=UPI00202AE251|nr:hypothetical protein [Alkalimarinus coralli]